MKGFISHLTTTYWGGYILIMEKKGRAFGRIYWYNNDKKTVYLDMLSVDKGMRKQGIGTKLQKMREKIGKEFGATTSWLWVKKDTWMFDWYKRRGYFDVKKYKQEKNAVWMRKSLIKINI